jgi:hypothetical protein
MRQAIWCFISRARNTANVLSLPPEKSAASLTAKLAIALNINFVRIVANCLYFQRDNLQLQVDRAT